MSSTVTVYLDGVDVTECCVSGSWTRRLNRPAQATVTLPMDCGNSGTFWPDAGSKLRIDVTPDGGGTSIAFHGFVLNCETDTDKDGGRTVYNAQDPMEMWQWRPVRADDCDFSKPVGSLVPGQDLFADYVTAPKIVEAALYNSINCDAGLGHPADQDREGEMFLDLGTFDDTGAPDVTGAPVDWPMTIMDLFSLMASTGTVDVILTPVDDGTHMARADGYPGTFGSDLSGSVVFEYGTGAHNAAAIRWNRDMTAMCNKYWLYGGPRIKTAADPAGDQHWCFNITGSDTGLPGYPGDPYATVIARRNLSRNLYGQRMKIDIFDAVDADCVPGVGSPGRELYRYQWIVYSYFAAVPREIIHVTPTRDTEIGSFDIGDIIGVAATADVRGGFSGAQRVYEYTISWDNDSVLTLSEIQTSADQE